LGKPIMVSMIPMPVGMLIRRLLWSQSWPH
jgi:hypothetical protein